MTTTPLPSVTRITTALPPTPSRVGHEFAEWLENRALELDAHSNLASELLPRLAAEQVFGLGVPEASGGVADSQFEDAVDAIAEVAQYSLTAAFVLWSQRSFIEYLLHTSCTALRERYLPSLLSGQIAGSTGLSNALKYLSGMETLHVRSTAQDEHTWRLQGSLPWLTNLRPQNYVVAVPIATPDQQAAIAVIAASDRRQTRSPDIALVALQASNTAALTIDGLVIDPRTQLLDHDAAAFIARVRPKFLALQCSMSLGLIQRCLHQVLHHPAPAPVLLRAAQAAQERLNTLRQALLDGVASEHFLSHPKALFTLRIALAELVGEASALESANEGGVSFIAGARPQTQRRLREAQFIPIVTPTVAQLKAVLAS